MAYWFQVIFRVVHLSSILNSIYYCIKISYIIESEFRRAAGRQVECILIPSSSDSSSDMDEEGNGTEEPGILVENSREEGGASNPPFVPIENTTEIDSVPVTNDEIEVSVDEEITGKKKRKSTERDQALACEESSKRKRMEVEIGQKLQETSKKSI